MKITKYVLLFAGVLFLFSSMALSQAIKVKVHISHTSTGDSVSLYFGFDKTATDCIALIGDEFGETEKFPPPGAGFDVCFHDPNPEGDPNCYGQGSFRDYRYWKDTLHADTFFVWSWEGGPFLYTWPAGLGSQFKELILRDAIFGATSIDMLTNTSMTTSRDMIYWYIIATPKVTTSIHDENQLPGEFTLNQNFPNPFNPMTTIHFDLPRESNVVLKIFDVLGREVRTILNERRIAGSYDVTVDASSLPSGLYFYRIIAGEFGATKKMMLLK